MIVVVENLPFEDLFIYLVINPLAYYFQKYTI
jgi:hypothetical protein